jgi:NFU1 iron-sulfur cluster scaffold homolog, mitochondrial
MFIQTEITPNPSTLKFLPGRIVLDEGVAEFVSAEEAGISPLATALFKVAGVRRVFFADVFVTVTRDEDVEWAHIKPSILGAIMDHYVSGRPVMEAPLPEKAAHTASATYDGDTAQIVKEIEELLATRVRPAVAQDGGDIEFDRFEADSGVLWLRMRGSCAGCPSSTMTLKHGIENMMRHYVPEVTRVEQTL